MSPVPATTGSLRTRIEDMQIGDYIVCNYQASSGAAGTFSNLGGTAGTEIPVNGSATPNGYFYFVKVDRGLLIADRVVQYNISWDTLNSGKFVEGMRNALKPQKVLMHMDDTTFKDELGHTISHLTNVYFSLDNKKFGIGSASFDGSANSWIDCGVSNDYSLPNGIDWTIDCWYYSKSKINPYPRVWQVGTGWKQGVLALLDRHNSYPSVFSVQTYGGPQLIGTTIAQDNTWYHLAVVKRGTTLSLYINGKLDASITHTVDINVSDKTLFIGGIALNAPEAQSNSYIDEFCFVKGIARWESNFEPPSAPYDVDLDNIPIGIVRSLAGGVAFADANGNSSTTDQGYGGWPTNNEWDKYIVRSALGGKAIPNDPNVWHHDQNVVTWCQDTPINGMTHPLGGSPNPSSNTGRIHRGMARPTNTTNTTDLAWAQSNWNTVWNGVSQGFRPVFEYKEA